MYQINIKLFIPVLASLFAWNVSFAEEVVYLKSSEPCTVEAYPAPEAPPLPEKLDCDEKATILERRGPIMRIQIGKDKVVWVDAEDTTTDVQPEQKVKRLMDYQKKIEKEYEVLNNKVKSLIESSEKLINALESSKKIINALIAAEETNKE
jgi:hypothetical protein